jgi:hypothetical protein
MKNNRKLILLAVERQTQKNRTQRSVLRMRIEPLKKLRHYQPPKMLVHFYYSNLKSK